MHTMFCSIYKKALVPFYYRLLVEQLCNVTLSIITVTDNTQQMSKLTISS